MRKSQHWMRNTFWMHCGLLISSGCRTYIAKIKKGKKTDCVAVFKHISTRALLLLLVYCFILTLNIVSALQL